MARIITEERTICSVYPLRLGPERRPYHPDRLQCGCSTFFIEAAPMDGYRTLTITDCWQRTIDYFKRPNEEGRFVPYPIDVGVIADDLVTVWTSGMITSKESGGTPGVGIIKGAEPTAEELKTLRAIQAKFFEGLFYNAQALAAQTKFNQITPLHRLAAKWLGREKEAIWTKELDPKEMKACPLCQSKVHERAYFCPNCRQQIAPIPKELQFSLESPVVVEKSGEKKKVKEREPVAA